MSKTKSYIIKLFKLIQENPELEILPIVDSEIVEDDGFHRWLGAWGDARIDEFYLDDGRYYLRGDDEEELQEKFDELIYLKKYPKQDDITDEQSKEIRVIVDKTVNNLPWKKVIVVNIDTL